MERKLFIIMLLSLMTMGAIDSKAQDFRHKHEPREQRMFCLSDEKFTILYNKVKNTSFDAPKMDLIEVASLGAFYSCGVCQLNCVMLPCLELLGDNPERLFLGKLRQGSIPCLSYVPLVA